MWAAAYGFRDIATALLEHGANTEALNNVCKQSIYVLENVIELQEGKTASYYDANGLIKVK